jgi:hypothetical protein
MINLFRESPRFVIFPAFVTEMRGRKKIFLPLYQRWVWYDKEHARKREKPV